MFQPHSLLWHYLWVAPNLLLALLACVLWKRGLHKHFRSFVSYACFQFLYWAVLYPIDLIPSIPAVYYWRAYWFGMLAESVIIFVLISDIFAGVFGPYAAVARLGRRLIRWGGALLLITATGAAAYAPVDRRIWLVSACHIVQEAMYIVVSGLVLLLFAAVAYFRLRWSRPIFGIAFGLGMSACIHLATWAIMANGGLADKRPLLDMLNLATTHVAVLIWFYCLLVPQKVNTKSAVSLPENNLAVWNRELERLLQR
jgi:hypothetical protein